ncbi:MULTISPECIES: restriction endonuclease subunit S [unclassified Corynebacterium]|uniref:restriction endonuclease subunit S n=1 Tax=unclassified Corynebacterium TaxID=2624378 RepID=UPI0034CE4770
MNDVKWDMVPLGLVAEFHTGWTPPSGDDKYYGGGHKWANISDVGNRDLYETERTISDYALERQAGAKPANPGDLLFPFKLSIGAVSFAREKMYTNEAIAVFPPNEKFDLRFFYYALPYFLLKNAGVNIYGAPLLNATLIKQARVPAPPIESQHRIADFLDRETSEIDAAVADLDKYVKLLEKRRRALVHETLVLRKGPGSGLSIGDSQRGRVGFVTRLLRRGISPSYVDEGVPVINQKCVRTGGFLDIASCRFHDSGARNIGLDLTIQPGDTLINSTGTGTLGRSCTVGEISVPTTWDSHVTLVRPNIDIADPGYLGWTILSQESKLVEFSTGSTNQIELSRDTIFNLDFVSIPLDLQKEVSAYLNRETAEIDSLIADSTRLRDLLLKRRSVLITEVVTGRKQV